MSNIIKRFKHLAFIFCIAISSLFVQSAQACSTCSDGICMFTEGFGFSNCWFVQVINNEGVVVWAYCSVSGFCFQQGGGYCPPGYICTTGQKNKAKETLLAKKTEHSEKLAPDTNNKCTPPPHFSELKIVKHS
jgi:hypothetical protein